MAVLFFHTLSVINDPFTIMAIQSNDRSDYWLFGPVHNFRPTTIRTNDHSEYRLVPVLQIVLQSCLVELSWGLLKVRSLISSQVKVSIWH